MEKNQNEQAVVPISYVCEDPDSPDGAERHEVKGARGQSLLDVALAHGIDIEHSCGGVCACSTCHVYIDAGMDQLCEPTEAEEDRVEEAPGLEVNSRLACQCLIEGDGPIVVRIPSWNRNAVKETPH